MALNVMQKGRHQGIAVAGSSAPVRMKAISATLTLREAVKSAYAALAAIYDCQQSHRQQAAFN
jgi:hypothetical protein